MAQQVTPLFDDDETHVSGNGDWLTAKAVIEKTGIDKRDLIRFIQMKVLPPSMMRVSPAGRDGGRKVSYFSPSILGHVAMLKMLRDEGHSVETIASELRETEELPPFEQAPADPHPLPEPPPPKERSKTDASLYFHLPAEAIAGSAFFVNQEMHIGWIKVAPGDRLFRAIANELDDDPSGTVFDLMLRASLKALIFDWQPLFTFTYRFLQAITPADTFERSAPLVSLHPDASDPHADEAIGHRPPPSIDSCPLRIETEDSRLQEMRFYAVALSGGALFLFEEDNRQPLGGADAAAPAPADAAADGTAGKTPFSVLSARLDDSRRMVDTLLPETYFQLMTRIWDETDRIVESCGGKRAKRSGTDVQYILPQHADTDPAFDAIRCAIALRDKMREIEASLKEEGGWFADIRLNIGISSGKDRLPADDLTASVAFMLPGGAADQAYHLSAIAQGGAILITKSAFGHISLRQMERITFGIYREDRLIPKIFSQVAELPQGPDTPPLGREIRSLFVTRIVDLQADKAD